MQKVLLAVKIFFTCALIYCSIDLNDNSTFPTAFLFATLRLSVPTAHYILTDKLDELPSICPYKVF